ncbi:PadR family transcriptional regulator [Actinokineospora sp.]|uniref:PadR family transcriptional regulator n=1 Tax=Actinokineospora sp. TaxID=1872133 RepID=UPI0040382B50
MTGDLAESEFVVLALLAEGETHGYEIRKLVTKRGFRLWTRLRRSSIYNALAHLDDRGLIRVRVTIHKGHTRKMYRITEHGTDTLRAEGLRRLADPAHPRNELDLGVYVLPFLAEPEARQAIADGLGTLRARREFLAEQLAWCRERDLRLPALAFERPLLALTAEIDWLERVAADYASGGACPGGWAEFIDPDHRGSSEQAGGVGDDAAVADRGDSDP